MFLDACPSQIDVEEEKEDTKTDYEGLEYDLVSSRRAIQGKSKDILRRIDHVLASTYCAGDVYKPFQDQILATFSQENQGQPT